jgi:hypothetical protein
MALTTSSGAIWIARADRPDESQSSTAQKAQQESAQQVAAQEAEDELQQGELIEAGDWLGGPAV